MPDYICPDCGGLITCLSCIEIHASQLPHGPAFVNQLYDQDWYRNDYLKQPKSDHNEELKGTEDSDNEELETIGVKESLSFNLSHFTDTLATPPTQSGLSTSDCTVPTKLVRLDQRTKDALQKSDDDNDESTSTAKLQ